MKKLLYILLLLLCIPISGCKKANDYIPAKIVAVRGDEQCIRPNTSLPISLQIEVLSARIKGLLGGKGTRHPVIDVPVYFAAINAKDDVSFPDGSIDVTDAGGHAEINVNVGDLLGDIYIRAAFSNDNQLVSTTFRIISGIEIEGNNQEVLAGNTTKKPLVIKVFDLNSKPVPNADVFMHVEGGNKIATLSKKHLKTDHLGSAEIFVTAGKNTKGVKVIAEVINHVDNVSYRSITYSVMSLNQINLIITLLGGLSIFIFGMKVMSEGLQHVAGSKLKQILRLFTKNRIVGVGVGAIVTALIQSSSACTVMIVGFVNAGLLTLQQTVGVIFGSNIGTTITAQIIAFKLDTLALPAITIGLVIQMLNKKNTPKFWGQVLMGFGLLFLGMTMMSSTLKPLKISPSFIAFFQGIDCSPVNGVMPLHSVLWATIIGALATVVIQSSSATIGLVIALAGSGLINIYTAIPLGLGGNIGTTITANLAAIGGSRVARRTALVHTLFNVAGTVVMLILFYVPYNGHPIFIYWVNKLTPGNVFLNPPENITRHVANAHSLFNVGCVIILLPFTNLLAWIATKMVPLKDYEATKAPDYLEEHLLSTPSIAIGQAIREMIFMYSRASKMVSDSYLCLTRNKLEMENDILKHEETVDELQENISNYLAKITAQPLTEKEAEIIPVLFHVVHDTERIGDLAITILNIAKRRKERNIVLSDHMIVYLDQMDNLLSQQFDLISEAFSDEPANIRDIMIQCGINEIKINELRKKLAKDLNKSISDDKAEGANGTVLLLDSISILERIGDHLENIAERIHAIDEIRNAHRK